MRYVKFIFLFVLMFGLTRDLLAQETANLLARKNIASLTDAELASLKRGIAAMKALPANDPTSWQFQANMHWTSRPTSPLHNQCEHTPTPGGGTATHFLAWHRGYLYYFERILQAKSGDRNLKLPYWNWRNNRALPMPFRSPAANDNPLYHRGRIMNDGSLIRSEFVNLDLSNALDQTSFFRFQSLLEGSPHGSIHGSVGGDMGGIATSARDPIFWLHHCNIDRLWDVWLNSGPQRQNSTNPNYLAREFTFADENGNSVTRTTRELLSSGGLGYFYDDAPRFFPVSAPVPPQNNRAMATSVSQFEGAGDNDLDFSDKRQVLSFSDQGQSMFENATAGDQPNKVFVKITGIEYKVLPTFTYGVYLNLPKDETDSDRSSTHYVGSINFFGTDHKHEEQGDAEPENKNFKFDTRLDISPAVSKLKAAGTWNPKKISVTLRPLAPVAPKGKEEEKKAFYVESAKSSKLKYEKIEVLTGN